jgi:hypothetical protein
MENLWLKCNIIVQYTVRSLLNIIDYMFSRVYIKLLMHEKQLGSYMMEHAKLKFHCIALIIMLAMIKINILFSRL